MSKRKNNPPTPITAAQLNVHARLLSASKVEKPFLDAIGEITSKSSAILKELQACTWFHFVDHDHIEHMFREGHGLSGDVFWRNFNQLIIYCVRTEATAALRLTQLLTLTMATENEIGLALAGRALIEHAAATYVLNGSLEPIKERLDKEVWPGFAGRHPPAVEASDIIVKAHLVRFAMGRRVQESGPMPLPADSKGAWERFNKSLSNVPEHLKVRSVHTDIDKFGAGSALPVLNSTYDFLCEYCHPNSSSRTFDFIHRGGPASQQSVDVHKADGPSVGFRNIIALLTATLPTTCQALASSLVGLNHARAPIPKSTPSQNSLAPRIGAILATDQYGRPAYIRPENVRMVDHAGVKLSAEQEQRVVKVFNAFGEFQRAPVKKWIDDFEKEPNPDAEILIWENMLRVFNEEILIRGGDVPSRIRYLLYVAVLTSVSAPSVDALLILQPELAQLPDLQRVHMSFHFGAAVVKS